MSLFWWKIIICINKVYLKIGIDSYVLATILIILLIEFVCMCFHSGNNLTTYKYQKQQHTQSTLQIIALDVFHYFPTEPPVANAKTKIVNAKTNI